jgi:hypothetical protein
MITDNTTFVSPMGLIFALLMCFLIVVLPRRYALVPVIILTCYMTMAQRIIVFGLDFTLIRVLTLFGWLRLIVRREFSLAGLSSIDRVLIGWVISSIATCTLLWQSWDVFINRMGLAYNAIGLYFFFRLIIQDREDILRAIKLFSVLIVPLAACMLLERITGRNLFAFLGGVPEFAMERSGTLRCQGPFAHPILAGAFGAALMPFFISLWPQGGLKKLMALMGIASSTVIVYAAGSSGPVGSYLAGAVALLMWPMRNHLRAVRWGIVLGLSILQIFMKAPVWFLLGRVSFFSGSDGWHRAYLIDRAVANFADWWLVGTKSTEAWGYSLWDVTNQFIVEASNGGLITLILFITIIVRCFRTVGLRVRQTEGEPHRWRFLFWALGASLLAHVTTYMSISYFDQNIVNWYLLLAMIATGTALPETHADAAGVVLARTSLENRGYMRGRVVAGPTLSTPKNPARGSY